MIALSTRLATIFLEGKVHVLRLATRPYERSHPPRHENGRSDPRSRCFGSVRTRIQPLLRPAADVDRPKRTTNTSSPCQPELISTAQLVSPCLERPCAPRSSARTDCRSRCQPQRNSTRSTTEPSSTPTPPDFLMALMATGILGSRRRGEATSMMRTHASSSSATRPRSRSAPWFPGVPLHSKLAIAFRACHPAQPAQRPAPPKTRNPHDANNALSCRLRQVGDPSVTIESHTFSSIAPGVTPP
jgi:hypothetical protein